MRTPLLLAAVPLALAVSPVLAQDAPVQPATVQGRIAGSLDDFFPRNRVESPYIPSGCHTEIERNDGGNISAVYVFCARAAQFQEVRFDDTRLIGMETRDYLPGQTVFKITRKR